MNARVCFLSLLIFLGVLAWTPAWSHEGHDHGAPEPVNADPSLVVRSASNDDYEVVLKYRSVRGQKSTTVIVYVSDFATNAPLDQARVALRTTAPRQVTATATAASSGIYEAVLPFEQAGRYTLILAIGTSPAAEFAFQDLPMGEEMVTARGTASTARPWPAWWWIGTAVLALAILALVLRRRALRPVARTALTLLFVGGGSTLPAQNAPADESHPHPEQNTSIPVQTRYMPKESQFFLGVRTIVAQSESLRARINAVGHVVPESGALASVEAPRDGKLEAVGHRLSVGDRVQAGQLIANLLVIDRLPIRAPISGLVAEVKFSAGQWVQAGDPLLVILDERQVRVELPLFGENLNQALRTRKATITSSALPGMLFPARVRGLAPTAPEPTRETETLAGSPIPPVLLTVTNRGGMLRPGMLVEASLELPTAMELIAVPESAVIQQESGSSVFVHTAAEVFEQRPVHVVGRYGNRIGLSGGVRPGDRIVVEGAQSLVSAPQVKVSASPDSGKAAR